MKTETQVDLGVMEAIYQRRAVRKYRDQAVDADTVQKLLAAAAQAPSALNLQPWVFAVLHGHRLLRGYSERAKCHLVATYPATFEVHLRSELYEDPNYDLFHGADTLIVIYAVAGRLHPNEECCLAAENLMLAAHALGLGTCPIGFARPWLDLPETKRELEVPEQYTAVFPVVVGYPAEAVAPTPRDPPNVVCWKWEAE